MRKAVERRFGGDPVSNPVSEQVRRTLVRSLYTQPTSLAVGALIGIVISMVAAYVIQDLLFTVAAIALSSIALLRTALSFLLETEGSKHSTAYLELSFELGAFLYAALTGLLAAMAIVMNAGSPVEVMLATHALCFGAGTCARNAGRPVIAIGQMAIAFLSVMVASLMEGSLPFIILGLSIPLGMLAMTSITINVFRTLRESISSAENSHKLAVKMERLARTDVVTGLANRAGLNHELVRAIMQIKGDSLLALFFLNLDRFKEVNDLFGHQAGDRVLAETAARLSKMVPEGGTVARFGGDEFVVFCEMDSRDQIETFAARLLNDLQQPVTVNAEQLLVGTSIGISVMPDNGLDAEMLLQHADLALDHAKTAGRGCSRFFDFAMTDDLTRRREIEAELRMAIERDELSVFFQPIIDLQSGKIRSFEALVRWFHPVKGEIRPDQFISVAEETGLIITLGNWITAQAAKACAAWPADVSVAVNLSPVQIKAPGAVLAIEAALRSAGLEAHRLELEVTESLFIEDSDVTDRFITELAEKGVRFAMDDFGTGYSSLAYISKYPFSKIKVDRSFVSGPDVGRKTEAIIRAVAEMGAQLDMDIVAEGLEEIEQVAAIRESGCTLGQGYYFSRAVPDYLATMLLTQEQGDSGFDTEPRKTA